VKQPRNPQFTNPPQWFHEADAAKCFSRKESPLQNSRRREAKRRALLQMLDRLPVRTGTKPAPQSAPALPADVPPPAQAKAGTTQVKAL